eukprot:m.269309 g.269309  ORF g.269309 m.269309 type:complete len:65 (-) comp15670_c0_seq8:1055-1249(-)
MSHLEGKVVLFTFLHHVATKEIILKPVMQYCAVVFTDCGQRIFLQSPVRVKVACRVPRNLPSFF